jgi:hypothetical protein
MPEYHTAIFIFEGYLLPMQSRLVPIAKFFNKSGIYEKKKLKSIAEVVVTCLYLYTGASLIVHTSIEQRMCI